MMVDVSLPLVDVLFLQMLGMSSNGGFAQGSYTYTYYYTSSFKQYIYNDI